MRLKEELVVVFLSYLLVVLIFPTSVFTIQVSAHSTSVLPDDGDAWTENNNETYTWKFHSSYKDTMGWSTVAKVGIYSLNVTHTKNANHMYFRLVLDKPYNVSAYDGVFFWLRVTSPDSSFTLGLYVFEADVNWGATDRFRMPAKPDCAKVNGTWVKYFVPFRIFEKDPSIEWSSIRTLYFELYGVGSADGTEVLIDNLHFRKFDIIGFTPSVDDTKILANTWYCLKNAEFMQSYDSKSYTSIHDWLNLTDSSYSDGTLETEVLAHNIFSLCLAYNYSGYEFYLNEAEKLTNWLLRAQDKNPGHRGFGGFHTHYTTVWSNRMQASYMGWILAGLSYLYGLTNNSTYSDACALGKEFLINTLWNSSLNVFNRLYNNATKQITYATGYEAMRDGASSLGLAYYYKFVEANSTVINILDKLLTVVLSQISYHHSWSFDPAKFENTYYQYWGIYGAYIATSNNTYRDALFNGTDAMLTKAIQAPTTNGSMPRYVGTLGIWAGSTEYLDGWGLHCALPLLFLADEIQSNTDYVNLGELALFNHLLSSQTSQGGWQRDNNIYYDRQYFGTPSFVIASLQMYLKESSYPNPYVLSSEGALIQGLDYAHNKLIIAIDSSIGTTSTIRVYCNDKDKPTKILIDDSEKPEGTVWSYDSSSSIVTINVEKLGFVQIVVDWNILTPHVFAIKTLKNGLPIVANITLSDDNSTMIETAENVNSTEWLLFPGTYYVQAMISYGKYLYASDKIRIDLTAYTMLAIDFPFYNLTVLCVDVDNDPIENCTVRFTRSYESHVLYTDDLGSTTLEAYCGNWTVLAYWMGVFVGGTNIAINVSSVELNMRCNVGDFTVTVVDQFGKPIKANITLTSTTVGLVFSSFLDGTKENITYTQIPLITYTLTVKGDFETQTYIVGVVGTRQIRIEVVKASGLDWMEKAAYILIGTLVGAITCSIMVWTLRKRKKM